MYVKTFIYIYIFAYEDLYIYIYMYIKTFVNQLGARCGRANTKASV